MIDAPLLVATKFHIPPAHLDLVARPRLTGLLERGAALPLTLVSAPPGFGKTMLVAAWLQGLMQANAQPVCCWLSLDEADSQPLTFWRYVIAALQRAWPGVGEVSLAMLATPQPLHARPRRAPLALHRDHHLELHLWRPPHPPDPVETAAHCSNANRS
jgi:ATP/maltotriose-dependent transcriptional regulator MalT